MVKKCIYCKSVIGENSVIDVCKVCGVGVWGEKMFNAIIQNMESAREAGDLYQGSISEPIPKREKDKLVFDSDKLVGGAGEVSDSIGEEILEDELMVLESTQEVEVLEPGAEVAIGGMASDSSGEVLPGGAEDVLERAGDASGGEVVPGGAEDVLRNLG